MPNIFRTGSLRTYVKLGTQTEHEDPHQRQAPWPPRHRKVTWRVWQVFIIIIIIMTYLLLADTSRTKRLRNTEIGGKVVHPTGNNAHQFQGQRSKMKVTGRLMLRPEVSRIFRMKRQTWYTDGTRRPASAKSAVTSNVKGQGRKVTWRVWQVLADKSRTKCPRNTKIGGKVAHLTCNNVHQVRGKRSKVKFTRPNNNSESESELQTWYAVGAYAINYHGQL